MAEDLQSNEQLAFVDNKYIRKGQITLADIDEINCSNGKGKAIPLEARCSPEDG